MDEPEPNSFNRWVKKKRFAVPEIYRKAAKTLKQAEEGKQSVKSLVYSSGFRDIKPLFALVAESVKHRVEITNVLEQSGFLTEHPSLDVHIVKVLTTELLWGKKYLKPVEARPIKIILGLEQKFREILSGTETVRDSLNSLKVPRYVRVNTLCASVDETVEFLRSEGWVHKASSFEDYASFIKAVGKLSPEEFLSDFHLDFVLVFHHSAQFYDHALLKQGKIILQDKASCLPPVVLPHKFKGEIIDACAAPGMKTSLLAALTSNKTRIYAVDRDGKRSMTLKQTLATSRANSVSVINSDFLSLNPADYPKVRYILVDPSCSGSGIVKRLDFQDRSDTEQDKQIRLRKLAGLQCRLLEHALSFPGVKRVAYSTCSIHEEENEQVVQRVLNKVSGTFKLKTALTSWERRGFEDKYPGVGQKCLRVDPVADLTNGFFVALFAKIQDVEH